MFIIVAEMKQMNAKLREALENSNGLLEELALIGEWGESAREQIAENNAALAEQKYEAKWELGVEYEYAYCSHCGHQQWASWDSHREAIENIREFHKEYKFCPNCGFEMKG